MFAWVLASGFIVGAPALKDHRKEDSPPAGRWQVKSHEMDGFEAARAPATLAGRSLEIDYSWANREEGQKVTWRVSFFRDEAGRQVEWAHSAYEWTPATIQKGIWKLEDNQLTICTGKPCGPLPTEYSGARGTGQTLIVLVRVGD